MGAPYSHFCTTRDSDVEYSDRAGKYRQHDNGYTVFYPNSLPPDPPVEISPDLLNRLSRAHLALGRLDGVTEILPNPDLFVYMYVRKEAVLSSQIEGTQASLIDVLGHEAEAEKPTEADANLDVTEVVNYINAMNVGLDAVKTEPLTLELIKQMHSVLLKEGRGSDMNPGEFRKVQNWVGSKSGGIKNAIYVPPPPDEVETALWNLENYIQQSVANNVLLAAGIAHAQFESIHPFLDGNGRIGRLLLTLLLVHHKIISKPLLYLSYYFKHRRVEYFDRLQAVRDFGDWEGWIKFYLSGLEAVGNEAADTAKEIVHLRQRDLDRISSKLGSKSGKAIQLLEHLYHQPIVDVRAVQETMSEGYQASNRLISSLEKIGILKELTGHQRNRKFGYVDYIAFFDDEMLVS